ncbi:MAG: DUF4173 domain-containing protein, partial [Oscillospiraceae bacterium]|nr:DUF4173 domain-containing protein [Oscillospiraceae bacterium]
WLFLIAGVLCMPRQSPVPGGAKLLLGAAALTALTCALHSVWWLNLLNALVSMALGLMGLFALTGRTAGWDSFAAVAESFLLTMGGLVRYFTLPLRSIPRWKSRGNTRQLGGVLLGLLAAMVLLVIVVPLLASADAIFDDWVAGAVNKLAQWLRMDTLPGTIWRVLRWAVLGMMLFSLLNSLGDTDRVEREFHFPAMVPGAAAPITVVLIALNLVYALFVFIQFTYLFGGVETVAMAGGFAEYARSGFFQLVKVSALNLATLLLAVRLLPEKGSTVVRGLGIVLVVFTGVLLVSAAYRMGLYISVYGLSVKRLLTLWAMVVIAVSMVLAAVKLVVRGFRLYRWLFLAALVLWLVLSAMNLHAVVAEYNVDAYLDGRIAELDAGYLGSLGYGAAPALNKLAAAYGEPGVDWQTWDFYMDHALNHYTADWRTWDAYSAWYYLR